MYYTEAYLSSARLSTLDHQHELLSFSLDQLGHLVDSGLRLNRTLFERTDALIGERGGKPAAHDWLGVVADSDLKEIGVALIHQQVEALSGFNQRWINWSAGCYHHFNSFCSETLARVQRATPIEGELPLRTMQAAVRSSDATVSDLANIATKTVDAVAGDVDAAGQEVVSRPARRR